MADTNDPTTPPRAPRKRTPNPAAAPADAKPEPQPEYQKLIAADPDVTDPDAAATPPAKAAPRTRKPRTPAATPEASTATPAAATAPAATAAPAPAAKKPRAPRKPKPEPAPAPEAPSTMRVLISGASGLIGTELVTQLRTAGHDVHTLVRHEPTSPHEHHWAPGSRMLDAGVLDGVDAVINLSGASLGRIPWTASYKKEILDSRIESTRALAEAIGAAASPPRVFLSASAVGIYGDRPAERLDDDASRGEGFLADVVAAWEETSRLAPETTRVVNFRTGIVVGAGGALAPLMPVTRFGLGSRVATGGQHWPWISLFDEAAAIRHLLTSELRGSVNLAGPVPATSDRLTAYLAKRMHRPYTFVLPEFVIRTAMGEAGRELLLSSQKVLPTRLLADGFTFRDSTVESAIDALIPR